LPSSNGIKKEDIMIIEDTSGTKKGTVQQLDEALGVGQLKEDLNDIRTKYTNLFNINTNIQDVNINNGNGTVYVNENYIDVEEGKPYFIYVKFKITNLINWVQGYVYARMIYAVDAGGWKSAPLRAIKNNSEFSICYNFIAEKSGKVGVQLYFNNQIPETNTFNCQCIKLFVAQTSDDIKVLVESEEQTNFISKIEIKPEAITWDNLSNDVKGKIERASTNYTIIDCWGDSLTQGAGATNYPYPKKLQELIGEQFVVNNYGQGSETAEVIAFRQGGMGAIVLPFTAGANASDYNKVTIKSINGASLETMSYSGKYHGNGNVYLNGRDKWMFRRGDGGSLNLVCADGSLLGKEYSRPTIAFAEGEGVGHVAIICIGQNGWAAQTSRPEALADIIQRMVEHNGSERYIVVGIPTGNANDKNVEEIILASRFSNHFVNAREYISKYGLLDSNLTPTQEDNEAMSIGAIPPQLKTDGVHLNDYGYIAMANCIYSRGVALGYWD
jgi:lysophospholipase L1-like esterase